MGIPVGAVFNLPQEPILVGAVRFALDRAKNEGRRSGSRKGSGLTMSTAPIEELLRQRL
jgi:hypothetical protein